MSKYHYPLKNRNKCHKVMILLNVILNLNIEQFSTLGVSGGEEYVYQCCAGSRDVVLGSGWDQTVWESNLNHLLAKHELRPSELSPFGNNKVISLLIFIYLVAVFIHSNILGNSCV